MDKAHDTALESDLMCELMDMRQKRGITQTAISQRIGVTNACVSQWELGVSYPLTFRRWQSLAKAVGVKLKIEIE